MSRTNADDASELERSKRGASLEESAAAAPLTQKRKQNVSVACNTCRHKRQRCDGDQPCAACVDKGRECIYNTARDLRRQRPNRDNLNELKCSRKVLDKLVEAIQNGLEAPFLSAIRQGASLEDLATAMAIGPEDALAEPSTGNTPGRSNSEATTLIPRLREQGSLSTDDFMDFSPSLPPSEMSAWVGSEASSSQPQHDRYEAIGSVSQNSSLKHLQFPIRELSHPPQHFEPASGDETAAEPSTSPTSTVQRMPMYGELQRHSMQIPPSIFMSSPGYVRSFGNLPFSSAIPTSGYSSDTQLHQQSNFDHPDWQVLPLSEVDDSPLGRVYTGFYQYGRKLITDGTPIEDVASLGPVNVDLYFRARLPTDPFNASTWASEVKRTFGDEFTHTVKLAGGYMMAKLMCWLLNPTPESYAAMPRVMQPTIRQRLLPHASAADLMPFTTFRDVLIENMRDFVGACARAGIDVNWPHSVNEALYVDPISGSLCIAPEFVEHISEPENWVIGKSIIEDFPEITDCEIVLAEEDVIRPVDRWL